MAAALGMIAGCQKPELVQLVAPEDAVAPVLETVEDVVFTEANLATDSYDFNWSPLDYGAKVEIDYTLEAHLDGGKPIELATMLKKPVFNVSYETLNGILNYKLGLEAGKATDVYFRVTGKFNDYEPVSSEEVKAKFTVVDAVAPVLKPFEAGKIEIDVDNLSAGKAVFSWEPAKYGKNTSIDYSLYVGLPGGEKKVSLSGKINKEKTSIEVAYKDINGVVLYDLEVSANVETEVAFYAAAKIGDFVTILSEEPVLVPVKVTEAKKEYKKIYMPGSYQSWKPDQADKNFQVLYEFTTPGVFEGIADFGKSNDAERAWKFTREPNWDFDWGIPEGVTPDPEAAEVTLHNNDQGNRSDIKIYTAKRYYHFTMDTNTGLLKNNYSFDQVGVVGAFTGWADGQDKVMEYNAAERRFWVDIEGLEGQFKFRLDGAWAKCWGANELGANVSNADGNLEAQAGNYRVYLYISNSAELSYELNRAMYGQEEPTAGGDSGTTEPEQPEQPVLLGWGLVGAFSGWADGADVMLASDGTYLVAKGVALDGEFKFRKDGAWGTNFGLAEGAAFAANTEIALAQDGANLVAVAGTYDVYLDEANAKAWFITDGSYPGGGTAPEASEWGVVGVVNNWGNTAGVSDVVMYKTSTEGLFVAYNVSMPDGGFKIRANNEWNDAANYGLASAGAVEVDHCYDVISSGGSGDMTLVAGNYDIWFDRTNEKVYIMTPGKPISEAVGGEATQPEQPAADTWYLVGDFNNWGAADANYLMTKEGNWYVFKGFTANGNGVKFVADSQWAVNRGGTFTAAGAAIDLTQGGVDIIVPTGTYDVYLNSDASLAYFMTPGEAPAVSDSAANTWYLVGEFNNWTVADASYKMTYSAGWHVFTNFTLPTDGKVKLNAGSWAVNRGGEFAAVGSAIAVTNNGADIVVPAGTYDVYLNKAEDTLYFMESGKTPAN